MVKSIIELRNFVLRLLRGFFGSKRIRMGVLSLSKTIVKDLCLEKVIDLSLWLSELEEKIYALSLEIERLREAVEELGRDLELC